MPTARILAVALALAAMLAAVPARAELEEVLVTSASERHVMVRRENGEIWRLDFGSTCPYAPGFGQQRLLLYTERGIMEAGARLLSPAIGTDCQAVRADSVKRSPSAPRPASPDVGLRAVREALELLGYDCGPIDRRGWLPQTGTAFRAFRESRRLPGGTHDVQRAITALALDVMKRGSGTGLRLSRILTDERDRVARWLQDSAGGTGCGEPAWIRTIAEDGRIGLSDQSSWRASDAATVGTRWQLGDEVRTCSGRMVNARTGEMVAVTR